MTSDERALVDRVELVLGRAVAIALPGTMANGKLAKWEDELGPALLAIVRRLDAENERMRAVLLFLRELVSDPERKRIDRALAGEK